MNSSDACCEKSCESSVKANLASHDSKALLLATGLVIFTIGYNLLEATLAIVFGEKAESTALLGFGLDSLIEVSAALLVFWRLIIQWRKADEAVVEKIETRVHRFVGFTFLLLAAYIAFTSGTALLQHKTPESSTMGIILAVASLIIMPALAWGKIQVAQKLGSEALAREAKETIACSVLSLILLVGLTLNALWGWWWADPVAALCMLPWLWKEGMAGLRGESCCG